jgi:hypothetical protein
MAYAYTPPETCPVCGERVPRTAAACPGCGADERTGWNGELTRYDGLDLPDDAYADENTEGAARKKHGGGLWVIVAVGLLVLLIFGLVLR